MGMGIILITQVLKKYSFYKRGRAINCAHVTSHLQYVPT